MWKKTKLQLYNDKFLCVKYENNYDRNITKYDCISEYLQNKDLNVFFLHKILLLVVIPDQSKASNDRSEHTR